MQAVNNHLLEFQEFLMDTLYSEDKVEILQQKLASFHSNSLVVNWVQSFAPSMLEAAARMMQHWGKKRSE